MMIRSILINQIMLLMKFKIQMLEAYAYWKKMLKVITLIMH